MVARALSRPLVGRADLARVAAALFDEGRGLDDAVATAAGILGFRLRPEERQPEESRAALGGAAIGSPASARPSEPAADVDDVVFWQPYSFTWKDDESREPVAVAALEAEALAAKDAEALRVLTASPPPAAPPLTPRARLVPLLDRALTAEIDGREIDVAALVRRWTRGEWVARLPRRPLRTWPSLLVIVDRGDNLATIASDMHMLLQLLVDRLGPTRLTLWELRQGEGPEELFPREAALVADGVLALTDLGWYSGPSRRRAWLRLGRQLRRAGQRIHALVPVPAARWTEALTRVWSPLAWERPSGAEPSPREREARVSRLLDLAAQARRLEPGLLRALRMLLPRGEADVGTEVDAWLHGDLASRCPGATVVRAERAKVRWARFAAEESAVKAEVAEAIRGWHARRRPELWSMEALALAERGVAVAEAELHRAERLLFGIQRRALGAAEVGDPRERAEIGHWLDYVARHAPALFYRETAAGRALQPAWGATHDPDEAPPHADPGLLALGRGAPRVASDVFEVCQVGDGLEVWPRAQARGLRVPPGGSVGALWAGDRWIYPTVPGGSGPRPVQITSPARSPAPPTPGAVIELRADRSSLVLRALTRPSWATAIGRDHRGLWAELEVAGVAVRLRWIPPGHFMMGSPSDEPGRYDDEVEHEVVLTRGYWLGETAVTQGLWEAVMGENPSRFKDPQRPVEQVSWEDAGRFLGELNRRIDADADGAAFRLPSEAEWEYACRGGTKTATYAGALEILGAHNAPVLDAIAWYGGNSGVDYDLEEAGDSSGWLGKQHKHSRAGTRRVREKLPNPWGLYDMLGNVYEWCADAWQRDRTSGSVSASARRPASRLSGALVDPHVVGSTGDHRVRRGGGWHSVTGYVRAASRAHDDPGGRFGYVGLRLARGQGLKEMGVQVPPEGAGSKTLVLLVNIGDRDDSWMTQAKLARAPGLPAGEQVFLDLEMVVDRKAIDGAGWRAMAEGIDRFVRDAEAKVNAIGASQCVVAGQAPLPAFAYLGQRLQGMTVPITFVNLQRGKGIWDVVPAPGAPQGSTRLFVATPPPVGYERDGRVVLGIQCSGEYGFGDEKVADMIKAEGGRLLGSYALVRDASHRQVALAPADLGGMMGQVDEALAWMAKERVTSQGLTVAIGGPAWVAFWVGNRLNPNNFGYRLDFPNFAGGRYVSALSVPMRRAPTRARLPSAGLRGHPLVGGCPPEWACSWGQDRRGVFAGFVVDGVEQRMRWIPPGGFTMGSPPDEPGRREDEGPAHEIEITRGFWLGDTPVTQGLWEAVMGSNPSHFKDPRRPVEAVSWEDCQAFCAALERLAPGLGVRLPSEAEWEYACRAGTKTATYAGAIEILGDNNAPVLDAIAWYGGNSGVGYDLEVAFDSSGWQKKQREHSRAGTRRVADKLPNPWGLHDMLGNVSEWCSDAWHPYGSASSPQRDPPNMGSTGDHRVYRGGSWVSFARGVRAALRSHDRPGVRNADVGLRLARDQEPAK